ncbi:MAG: VOC family protein [Ilumatobacteraceae bacterium]|jgi:predicted enzyme related to lactoylglutathione lyase|nr:VOC family protein [Acidimicrobiia bacterium]
MSQPYPNILVFVDFPVDDVEAASDFYRTVMGWEVETRIPGIFNRIVPGQNFKVDDGSQGPTGNLHMGISYAGDARPDPRDDADRESPKRRLHDGGRTTRAWILVSDDDEMDAIMDRAVANGGTELWRHHFWTEFGGANASFLDPWGNQLMLWEHLDGIEQDEETHELVGDAKLPDGWTIE